MGQGAKVVCRDGPERAEDLHQSRWQALLHPYGEPAFQVFVWKDRYPNGFPKTTDEWLKEGERLKKEGKYALTFFGSTAFNGNGADRARVQTIVSFGGGYDDGNGKFKLNTPENVAAVALLREMVQKGYVPEIAFAGGFQEEQAFMDSSAGAIPTGLFGYRYMNPLTAPSGKKYEKKTQDDMLDAIDGGRRLPGAHACAGRQEAGLWHRYRGPRHS